MKAYVEGTNPRVVMDKERLSQIKLFMGPNALRGVKHALKDEFCDWNVLKKCLETVFDRHSLKYSTLHGHFLFREQKSDESFSSFFKELWTLCDGMAAIQPQSIAKFHVVEENYYKAYSESMSLLTKRQDSGSKLNVTNVNTTKKERSSEPKMHEYNVQEFKKQDTGTAKSRTPDTSRDMNKNQVTQPNRLSQVTCDNCQQKGHVSRYCRNK